MPVGTIKKDSLVDTFYITQRKEGLYVLTSYYLSYLRDRYTHPDIYDIDYYAQPHFWLSFDTTQLRNIGGWYSTELLDGACELTKVIDTKQDPKYVFTIFPGQMSVVIIEITLSPINGLMTFRTHVAPKSYLVKSSTGLEIAYTPDTYLTCKCETDK